MSAQVKPVSRTLDDERTRPDSPDQATFQHHVARYRFALNYVQPPDMVLDSACGTGYGASMLHEKARQVIGVDISPLAISYCRQNFAKPGLSYLLMDGGQLAFPDSIFDLVVSFEVFEHLVNSRSYLQECFRVLRPGGRLLLSTPNSTTWNIHLDSIHQNYEFHINMVDLDELRRQLRGVFRQFTVFGQRRRGNPIYTALRSLDPWNLRLRLVPPQKRESMQRSMGVASGTQATERDWIFSHYQLRQSNHFLALCKR